jgi:dephospho-CoA kinase
VLRVGLTGGIASGKTAVSEALRDLGAVVIDADGRLDRAALGAIVFADSAARRDLEAIVHPAVRARAAAIEAAAGPDAVVVHVIPLLVETGQHDDFDVLVVVDIDPQLQLDRLRERTGLDDASARARVAAQVSRSERLAVADVVLDNNGSRADLRQQINQVWRDLHARATAG